MRIRFINNVGLEEAGIDGGGLFKEFINEVLKTALDPNRGFFIMTAENTFYPNPNIERIIKNFTEHYFFIGRLIGKVHNCLILSFKINLNHFNWCNRKERIISKRGDYLLKFFRREKQIRKTLYTSYCS